MTQELGQGVNATLVAVRNGPGARLRAAREATGFTQLEVAQQLRLSADMIARLEEDNYDPSMPLVFVKGYLRSYAGLVGIDAEQVIIEFGHLGIKDPVRDVPDLGQSPQRKLSNFNAGTPKHRPGLLWGSLAIFACGMLAFMWMYRDQIPALSAPEGSSVTTSSSTNSSTEETELNAALEAARKANAQAAAAANAPEGSAATPAAGAAAANGATATTGTTGATGTTASTGTATSPQTPVTATASPKKTTTSSDEEEDDTEHAIKPVSANTVVKSVPKKVGTDKTHETMLF